MSKTKLSIRDQIIHMKDLKGVNFSIINETDAEKFLMENNYYFKLKSYAKNYDKYVSGKSAGKYINLEFAYLKELSTLDMYLRKFIIKMTLDIEHFLKIQLVRDVSDNPHEDGYSFVQEFFKKYTYVENSIQEKSNNSVCCDLVQKYKSNFAVWNIIEVLSFGDFIKLYQMYYNKYPKKDSMVNNLWSVKFLRNAAAHNNCLINSLKHPYNAKFNFTKEIDTFVSRIPGIGRTMKKKKFSNPVVHDFVVSLYVFNAIVGSPIKMHSMHELKDLFDNRFKRNKHYFVKNDHILSHYKFIKIIVDYFYSNCI